MDKRLKVIPIGGLNEIGKNMTILEIDDQILIIDCGMSFPDYEMYGIDVVIPDFSYIIENRNKVVGMIITHGHEDHIGAIPYLLKDIKIPIYATKFTLGLIEYKLKEHDVIGDLRLIHPGESTKIGCFKVEAIRTTHSIADSLSFAINTPIGYVFHSGDFKVDYTPLDNLPIDLSRLAEIGNRGVKLMLCDSTNATKSGYTRSEQVVKDSIGEIFRKAKNRIIIATFSSNVHRIQAIIDNAVKCGRKVAFSGRSMENIVRLADELGYIHLDESYVVDLSMIKNIPDDKLVIVTTGSQGEPMSALSRIASGDHKMITLKKGDMVILSSTPIPGNEKTVSNVVNELYMKGAEVIYSDIADIHVSGHANQEDLRLIHSLIKPEYFIPIHGEYRHLAEHKNLAVSMGIKEDNAFILRNGDILEITDKSATVLKEHIPSEPIFVDGLGVGDVGNIVLRDRKNLSQGGLIIVALAYSKEEKNIVSGPDIISRGFVYVRENEELIENARNVCLLTINEMLEKGNLDWQGIKGKVKKALSDYIYITTNRTPVILPIFMEV